MSISIVYDYSEQSHVLLGDFKDEHIKFREEVLRPAEYAHFNSRLYTGPGWIVDKVHLDDLVNALKSYNLPFAETTFDKEIRTTKRKENWRKASQRRGRKATSRPVSTPSPWSSSPPKEWLNVPSLSVDTHPQPAPMVVDTPSQPAPMVVDAPPQPVDHTQWAQETIDKEYRSIDRSKVTFIHQAVVEKIRNYIEHNGLFQQQYGVNIIFTFEERLLVDKSMERLRELGFTVLIEGVEGVGNYFVTKY